MSKNNIRQRSIEYDPVAVANNALQKHTAKISNPLSTRANIGEKISYTQQTSKHHTLLYILHFCASKHKNTCVGWRKIPCLHLKLRYVLKQ